MTKTGIIGGSGLDRLASLTMTSREAVPTPYGDPSGVLTSGKLCDKEVVFLPRHGMAHTIPPHAVNYRANIWALKSAGVSRIVAFAAVGGIRADCVPGVIVLPDQLIDYTWAREHTFFDGDTDHVHHIDFTDPYSKSLRKRLLRSAEVAAIEVVDGGTYAATQGPRLETAAEILRLERDGATIVGMTGMPEASLARELGIDYACVAIVVNPAAGKAAEVINMEDIQGHLQTGVDQALRLLENL